ncbi:MAG: serine/threonine-protein kinase [Acidobacteriota bacterium]|nr:serine/threonine-protein kinase [Acidobacteriota bacterium]
MGEPGKDTEQGPHDPVDDTLVPDTLGGLPGKEAGAPSRESWFTTPEFIGPYKILKTLGRGGMGWVYLAGQEKPRRDVALKLLGRNAFTAEFLGRFEVEYHTLARMESEHIARIYDVGTTGTGDPYFTMEYVDGLPINTFCKENELTITERLELFLQVCEGVLHAHQRAVVHRDLKPSNILVTQGEQGPLAKIIDFGIAKSLRGGNEERRFETQVGAIMGTPAYTSPEQLGQPGASVDTRTDIYALGVILYEMLTGLMPLEERYFQDAGWDEMLRLYREEEPPDPSSRLGRLTQADLSVKRLHSSLKGDLDRVVMKAMAKRIKDRYDSVGNFMSDIRAYLEGFPVSVGPPNPLYRVGKYARRYRVPVLALLLTMLGLTVGLAVTLWSRERVARERNKADYLSTFLWGIMETPDPRKVGPNARVIDLVDKAVQKLEDEPIESAELEAQVRERLGSTYTGLGSYDKAIDLLEEAYVMHLQNQGPDAPETLRTQHELAVALVKNPWPRDLRNQNYQRALELFRDCADRRLRALGESHRDTLNTRSYIAHVYHRLGRFKEGLDAFSRVHDRQVELFNANDEDSLVSLNGIAMGYQGLGQHKKAREQFENVIPLMRQALGHDDPRTLAAITAAGKTVFRLKDYQSALKLFTEAATTRAERLGPDHPDTLRTLVEQARTAIKLDRNGEAAVTLKGVLERHRAKGSGLDDAALETARFLGRALRNMDRLEEAIMVLEGVVEACRKADRLDRPIVGSLLNNLGYYLIKAGRPDEAVTVLQEALPIQETQRGKAASSVYITRMNLAEAYSRAGRSEALALWRMIFEDDTFPRYREEAAKIVAQLRALNLPVPDASTSRLP